jgi:hypothetical protein
VRFCRFSLGRKRLARGLEAAQPQAGRHDEHGAERHRGGAMSFFSILAAHEAHVIPPIASSTRRGAPPGLPAELSAVNALTRITAFPCASACTRIVRKKDLQAERAAVPAPADLSRGAGEPPGVVLSLRRAGSRRPRPPSAPPCPCALPRSQITIPRQGI